MRRLGVFFADANTMYVADEGSANATDATTHAGLQKWSLVNGTWQLDYVLTKGLIGTVDTNLTGPDGQYPDVTTSGLRNLTGHVQASGMVTLWRPRRPPAPQAMSAPIPTGWSKSATGWRPRP